MAEQNTKTEPTTDEELREMFAEGDVTYEQMWLFPDWPGDEDTLETTVRRHGGRLPGSDPRR